MKKRTQTILWAGIVLFFLFYTIVSIIHYSQWKERQETQNNGNWKFYLGNNRFQLIAPDIVIDTFFVDPDSLLVLEEWQDSLLTETTAQPAEK